MIEDGIKLTIDPDRHAVARLGSRLTEYNRSRAPQEPPCGLLLSIDSDTGELIAGLYGHISYTWLVVEALWVVEHARGGGYGTRLLRQAEEYAREHGCHAVWLDTFSFQAHHFYKKLGYIVFGELPNYPDKHRRYFLWKKLT